MPAYARLALDSSTQGLRLASALLTPLGDLHRPFLEIQALRVETLALQPCKSLLGQIGTIGSCVRGALDDLVLLRNLGRLRQRLGIHDAQAEG